MKVYLCYECHYDYCDVFRTLSKVVDDEAKALVWKEDFIGNDNEWREYEEKELE